MSLPYTVGEESAAPSVENPLQIGAYEKKYVESNVLKPLVQPAPNWSETFKAAILQENTAVNLGSGLIKQFNPIGGVDETFNPLDPQYLQLVEPRLWPKLAEAQNEGQLYNLIDNIGIEEERRRTMAEGPLLATLASGFTDPTVLWPIAKGISSLKLSTSVLQGARSTLPAFVGGAAVAELSAHYAQELRTIEESATNIGVSALMGGVLGGAGGLYKSLNSKAYKALFEEAYKGNEVKFHVTEKGELNGFVSIDDSVGAQSTRTVDLKKNALYGWGDNGDLSLAALPIWATAKLGRNPVLLGLTSKSGATRRFTNEMLQHNFHLAGAEIDNVANANAVQKLISQRQSGLVKNELELARSYYEYLGIPEGNIVGQKLQSLIKDTQGKMKIGDFMKEVSIATVNGGKHENPVIQREATRIIKEIIDPFTEELVELGLLAGNVSPYGAAKHLSRMPARENILADRPNKEAWLAKQFGETNDRIMEATRTTRSLEENIGQLNKSLKEAKDKLSRAQLKKKISITESHLKKEKSRIEKDIASGKYTPDMLVDAGKNKLKFRKILDNNELSLAARNTIDNMLGLNEDQIATQIQGALRSGSGGPDPLKPRTLFIEDELLYRAGFLETDIRKNLHAGTLRMSRLIEMEKYLRSRGYNGDGNRLDFIANGIKEDYNVLKMQNEAKFQQKMQTAEPTQRAKLEAKEQKNRTKLAAEEQRDVDLATDIYSRIMGAYDTKSGNMVKAVRFMKNWAYSTQLGALFLLCLQDAMAPMYKQFVPYLQYGVAPWIGRMATFSKGNARLKQQAQDFAVGIETVTAMFSKQWDYNSNMVMPMNGLERMGDYASRAMSVANLSSPWTDTFKVIAATATQSRIARDLLAHSEGKLSKKWHKQLLGLGIDPDSDVGRKMLEQIQKHSERDLGSYVMNWQLWDTDKLSQEAKNLLQASTRQEVESTILKSGNSAESFPTGVDPQGFFAQSILMYMGWGFNATANYLIPTFQKFNTDKAAGLASMMAISALVEPLRAIATGREPDLKPDMLFKNAVLNSGVLGVYSDLFNKINSVANIVPGLQVDRYKASRGIVSAPWLSIIEEIGKVTGAVANGEMNKTDLKRALKLIPLTNLIYLRQGINELVDQTSYPESRKNAEQAGAWRR